MAAIETRMGATALEIREDAGEVVLEGYASTFSQPYDMGFYRETVAPGAFSRTLGRKPDVRLLINHDDLPLARTTSGTLSLSEDAQGLLVRASLDASDPDVARLVPKMKRGDLNQMSFGFRIDGQGGQEWSDDRTERTLRSLDLNDGDVSVVTFPANPSTRVGVRAGDPDSLDLDAILGAIADVARRDGKRGDLAPLLARYIRSDKGLYELIQSAWESDSREAPAEITEATPESDEEADARRAALLATERQIAQIRALIAR